VTRYIRYLSGAGAAYGIVEGDKIRELRGNPLDSPSETGATRPLNGQKLLCPCEPGKIVAVGRNYRSHLGNRAFPKNPEIFYKPLSSLQDPDGAIVIPPDAVDVHYEGELVLVVGKRVKDVRREEALSAIFGATCGNDVTDRNWQYGEGKDVQWWRAKGSDTFAPVGPTLVTGLDWDNLLLQTRLNGEVVQKERTADFIFDCATMVSWISRWVTLMPGDLIFTGTPGATRRLAAGDVVEVEIEGIGTLRNPVT
jgi:2-keto-4-pentenoate hydratase/2-oxohepta-3-ene-1,7-dioic acid hydratase in catechol pathway